MSLLQAPIATFMSPLRKRPLAAWSGILDQVLVRGNKFIWEVAFFHKPSKTLLVVDLIENFTDQTPNVNWLLKLWWKVVFHMWDNPKPAPRRGPACLPGGGARFEP